MMTATTPLLRKKLRRITHRSPSLLAIGSALVLTFAVTPPASASVSCPEGFSPVGASVCEVRFTTPGATTWTVPDGVSTIHMMLVGGGGGGAGGGADRGGGGGGGGGWDFPRLQVTPGTTFDVVIGAGGAGGGGGSNGSDGGVTSFNANGLHGVLPHVMNGGFGGQSSTGAGGNSGDNEPGGASGLNRGGGGGGGVSAGTASSDGVGGIGGSGAQPASGPFAVAPVSFLGPGGGGGGYNEVGGLGGITGAGDGGDGTTTSPTGAGTAAIPNSGGGGGGGGTNTAGSFQHTGGNGGSGVLIIRIEVAATSGVSLLPPPVVQQFGKPSVGTCNEAASSELNWAGVSHGGWGDSWAQWMNDGSGGFVCTRTLVYSAAQSKWIID